MLFDPIIDDLAKSNSKNKANNQSTIIELMRNMKAQKNSNIFIN
jgi:hypothetical protein